MAYRLFEKCACRTALPFDEMKQPRVSALKRSLVPGHLGESVRIGGECGAAQEAEGVAHEQEH
eukprot:scaffold5177_cov31-Tisochrysis_lutea.AAC.1